MIFKYNGLTPRLGPGCYVAPTATVLGDVVMGAGSSVWFSSVVRGDVNSIRLGEAVNVQDAAVLHVTTEFWPLVIGDYVTIGHGAIVHGCTLGDRVLVGMGAIVLDGAVVGEDSIVAAGALVPEGAEFPARSMLMGIPAKRVRDVSDVEIARAKEGALRYRKEAAEYLTAAVIEINPDTTD